MTIYTLWILRLGLYRDAQWVFCSEDEGKKTTNNEQCLEQNCHEGELAHRSRSQGKGNSQFIVFI